MKQSSLIEVGSFIVSCIVIWYFLFPVCLLDFLDESGFGCKMRTQNSFLYLCFGALCFLVLVIIFLIVYEEMCELFMLDDMLFGKMIWFKFFYHIHFCVVVSFLNWLYSTHYVFWILWFARVSRCWVHYVEYKMLEFLIEALQNSNWHFLCD